MHWPCQCGEAVAGDDALVDDDCDDGDSQSNRKVIEIVVTIPERLQSSASRNHDSLFNHQEQQQTLIALAVIAVV